MTPATSHQRLPVAFGMDSWRAPTGRNADGRSLAITYIPSTATLSINDVVVTLECEYLVDEPIKRDTSFQNLLIERGKRTRKVTRIQLERRGMDLRRSLQEINFTLQAVIAQANRAADWQLSLSTGIIKAALSQSEDELVKDYERHAGRSRESRE